MAESDLHSTWIRLRTGKEFSRMLYPNPVCFLSTWKVSASSPATASSSAHHDNAVVTAVGSDNTRSGEYSQLQHAGNAMVLSWLTPTNNSGRFMFSINKSRYSASLLAPPMTDATTSTQRYRTGVEFTLSVPTRGMEQVILDTGSISGRFGSKFALERVADSRNHSNNNEVNDTFSVDSISNRKRKKQKMQQLSATGVPGLTPIPYCSATDQMSPQTSLFVIDGTVAFMKCRTYGINGSTMPGENQAESDARLHTGNEDDVTQQAIIDHDHLLVMAEVVDAHVHRLYWDDKKLLFRPVTEDVPPYLTFLGSQTFGYMKTS
jgi:hypothetical protein